MARDFGERPTETMSAIAVRVGTSPDRKTMAIEFLTTDGRHVGVALVMSAARDLRTMIDAAIQGKPPAPPGKAH